MRLFSGAGARSRPRNTIFVACALFVSLATAEGWGFTFPSASNPCDSDCSFSLGEVLDIRWKTPFEAVNLAVVAEDTADYVFLAHNDTQRSFAWDVNVNLDAQSYRIFYLYLENAANVSESVFSSPFRVIHGGGHLLLSTESVERTTHHTSFQSRPTNAPSKPLRNHTADTVSATSAFSHRASYHRSSDHSLSSSPSTSHSSFESHVRALPATTSALQSHSRTTMSTTTRSRQSSTPATSTSSPIMGIVAGPVASPNTPTSAQASASSASSRPANPSAKGSGKSDKPKSLSPGTSVGIAVGAVFGAAVVSGVCWLLRRHALAKKCPESMPRSDSAGSGSSVLLAGQAIGTPTKLEHSEGNGPGLGQAMGSPGRDGARATFMHGALSEIGAARPNTAASRANRSSRYGVESGIVYGLPSYYDMQSDSSADRVTRIPPLPARFGYEVEDGTMEQTIAEHGQKFTHMYWDNLDDGRNRMETAPQVRHDPWSPRDQA